MYKKFAKSSSSSISNFSDDNNIPINKKRLHNKPNPIKTTNNIENESEQKKYQKIINSAKKNPLKYHEYTKLKYKDHIYNQNDTIMILNCDDPDNDFVAILTKIIKAVHQGCLHIIVEVQWY